MKPFAKFALPSTSNRSSGLGFGCMGMTAFYGDPLPDEKCMELLQAVYDGGCRHFDTAELYHTGDLYNEAVIGKFFKKVPRDSFSVATKFMPYMHDNDCSYDSVKKALVASLERLQLDYADLYYSHRVPSLECGMDFAASCKRLQDEGLIKEIGLSEVRPEWLKKIHTEVTPISAIQQEWSLLTRNLEEELVPLCKELDIVIVAYSPLARNLLASKVETPPSDWRATNPRYQPDNLKQNASISDILQDIADKYECTPAQLALSWLFHNATTLGVSVVPIPGSTKLENSLSNLKSTKVDISDNDDVKTLESLADMVAGKRGDENYIGSGFESQTAQ